MRRLAAAALAAAGLLCAQSRQVALTFDDLPRGGDTGRAYTLADTLEVNHRILDAMRGQPVTGFVNPGGAAAVDLGPQGLQTVLRLWHDRGAVLGNHTFSHPDLNRTPPDAYIADILRAEPALEQALGRRPAFFRHPFLHAGATPEARRAVEEFLAGRGYQVAPVTLDNSDWLYAALYQPALRTDPPLAARLLDDYLAYMESIFSFFETRSIEVVGREIPQVLLLHVNRLNADALPRLLAMMRRRGYQVVPLEHALSDAAYRLPDSYAGPGGFSWLHRWSKTKGMAPKTEPDTPAWVTAAFERLRGR
jgi:peptidoglycan/xylan/chitin deacetylase (PgdA/CDA1 family)